MKALIVLVLAAVLAIAGCDGHVRTVWHEESLPSGRTVKITSFNLVWGVEHGERDTGKDCFALEYVWADPQADPARREAEATEVFELVRPLSERWGFRAASMAGFPTLERKGRYDLYWFERQADGHWSFARSEAKVFAND